MPCVVFLTASKKKIIVKSNWCQAANDAANINDGSRPGKRTVIFLSPDKSAKPNFQLKVQIFFNPEISACYYGYILKHFGKHNGLL